MLLWVTLLAADAPWLTDNNAAIACELGPLGRFTDIARTVVHDTLPWHK